MKYLLILLAACLFTTPEIILAHSGRTNAQGCHNDNVNGGYHCHGAPSTNTPTKPQSGQSSSGTDSETNSSKENCHPNYSGCLKADASDYDCAGGSGNGPYYTGRIRVVGPDVFRLDADGDGIGCE